MKNPLIGLAVAGLVAMNASATVLIIDGFDDTQVQTCTPVCGAVDSGLLGNVGPFALDRQLRIDGVTGPAIGNATAASFGGLYYMSTDSGISANTGARYSSAGLIDLTGLIRFTLGINSADLNGGTIEFYARSGGVTYTTAPPSVLAGAPPTYSIDFPVAGFGALDPSKIEYFGFRIIGVGSFDMSADFLSAEVSDQAAVPEPTTMVFMGIGLLGLGILGRRLGK